MMMRPIDPMHLDAFVQMLARPDAIDLPRRANVCRYDGDPDRRTTRYPQILMSWLQRRHLEADGDEPLARGLISKGRATPLRPRLTRTTELLAA